jgi:hypothetical protein
MSFLRRGPGETFESTINRWVGIRSPELDDVVAKVNAYLAQRNGNNLLAIIEAVTAWRTRQPKEYASRLGKQRQAFEDELARAGESFLTRAFGTSNYVARHLPALNEFARYAVQDVKTFSAQVNPAQKKEVFARYWHWNRIFPPTRFRMAPPALASLFPKDWAAHLRQVFESTRYTQPQTVAYRAGDHTVDNVGLPKPRVDWGNDVPADTVRIEALGSAVCTSFAKAGAHVLLRNADADSPRVEIVSWSSGNAMEAHVYVLVGRDPYYMDDDLTVIPPLGKWNKDTVVVDPWAAALGHPVWWRPGEFPATFVGMASPLTLVMSSEDLAPAQ